MASFTEHKSFVSELFKERELRPFKATQQQLQIAKQSLIYKKKCNSNVHSLLFCKAFSTNSSEFATQNEKKILEEEKSKYFDYIRKTFKEKIPEDFQSQNKLKKALKTKIIEKKQNQTAKNSEEVFKRPRMPASTSKDRKIKQKEEKGTKKLKKTGQTEEKNIVADQEASNQAFEDDNFQSQIDLHNDEVEESYGDEQDEV